MVETNPIFFTVFIVQKMMETFLMHLSAIFRLLFLFMQRQPIDYRNQFLYNLQKITVLSKDFLRLLLHNSQVWVGQKIFSKNQ